MLEMLRRGTIKIVENVEFPLQFSVDVPRLRDVEFINSSLWLTIDGGWFGRAEMSGCRFIDCELDALRVRKANLSSTPSSVWSSVGHRWAVSIEHPSTG